MTCWLRNLLLLVKWARAIHYKNRSSWSKGSFPSYHARRQRFKPRRHFKLLLDPGDFSLQPQRTPTSSLTWPLTETRHYTSMCGLQYGCAVCCVVSVCNQSTLYDWMRGRALLTNDGNTSLLLPFHFLHFARLRPSGSYQATWNAIQNFLHQT